MIDLHTHSLLSDGELLPSELARRYKVLGYKAIAITDHADESNLDAILPRIVVVCEKLSRDADIKVIPGIELTHIPPKRIQDMARRARQAGAKLILVHGQTISEPVRPGTNRKALESDIDILAHPGLITNEEAKLAAKRGIYLEITTRPLHAFTNGHIVKSAETAGAKLVLNPDSHSPDDILSLVQVQRIAQGAGLTDKGLDALMKNAEQILKRTG